MGWRTRCPHNSDKAPAINAADDYSNVAVGGQKRSLQAASGTMPFSALVFSSGTFKRTCSPMED